MKKHFVIAALFGISLATAGCNETTRVDNDASDPIENTTSLEGLEDIKAPLAHDEIEVTTNQKNDARLGPEMPVETEAPNSVSPPSPEPAASGNTQWTISGTATEIRVAYQPDYTLTPVTEISAPYHPPQSEEQPVSYEAKTEISLPFRAE